MSEYCFLVLSGKLQPTLIVGRSEKLFIDTGSNMMYICSKTSVSCSTEARQNFSGNLTENVKPHISRFWIAGDVDIFGKVILKGVRAFSLQSCNGSILINSSYPIKGSCNQASATKGRCLGGTVGKCGQLGIGKSRSSLLFCVEQGAIALYCDEVY